VMLGKPLFSQGEKALVCFPYLIPSKLYGHGTVATIQIRLRFFRETSTFPFSSYSFDDAIKGHCRLLWHKAWHRLSPQ
jgi:hypothetical protein